MRLILVAAVISGLAASSALAAPAGPARPASQDTVRTEARQLFAEIIAFPTVEGRGAVPAMAAYLAGQMRQAGFSPADIQIQPLGETASLIVHYPGRPGSVRKPVLFLAHMDVVDASQADWGRDPWTLTEVDGMLYGRGVVDNKYGVLTMAQAFMRLKREGFVPDRDLVLIFTGDEETVATTTQSVAPQFGKADYAVNSDAGGGYLPGGGGKAAYSAQVAEKTYATFEITARNSGGHSSAPRADNAIYQLSAALQKVGAYRFPARWNAVTLSNLAQSAPDIGGDLGQAMARFATHPGDPDALVVIDRDPTLVNEIRTTCVATRLKAGHAENALPVAATATVNCRIFPGETVAQTRATLASVMADDSLEIAVLGNPLESDFSTVPEELNRALTEVLSLRAPGVKPAPYMEAGASDGLYFRAAGIPTIGAGPLFLTDNVDNNYHGNNERLTVAQFNDGLDHYYLLIKALTGGRNGRPIR
ncbi:MAG: M20/M25/M40 family metallo-hydrolase [Caulobacter sp.]|nr:M20/M25/M40 family metallo-hydrolase [Caulobacter sp.]